MTPERGMLWTTAVKITARSADAQQVLDFHGIPAQDHDILQKPFTEAGLLSRVRQALNRARIPAQREPDSSDQREPGLDVGQQ
jgi:DNA-binding response OmpR family regulator